MQRSVVVIAIWLAVTACGGAAEARLDLYVDKSTQRIAVVQDGYMRYVWPVSTGRDNYATPNGTYVPERLERTWFSKAYYDSPMPYSIFFHNGYAIHGSYDIARLGGPASHGCVRLYPQHAAILFEMVEQEGPGNTRIVIGGDGPPSPQAPRYRESDGPFRSTNPGDGGFAKGGYPMPPRPAPYYGVDRHAEAPDRQRGGDSQLNPQWPRYRDTDDPFRPANPGDGGLARGGYPMRPPTYYGMDHYVDAPGGLRGDREP